MRYSIHMPDGRLIGNADSAQSASDMACNWLFSNPLQGFSYTVDTIDGNAFPFVRYCRAQWGLKSFIGTPYHSLMQCLEGKN